MKVTELFESKKFEASFRLGRFTRSYEYTDKTIHHSKALTPAEIRRILKLDVGSAIDTMIVTDEGRQHVHITRIQ